MYIRTDEEKASLCKLAPFRLSLMSTRIEMGAGGP